MFLTFSLQAQESELFQKLKMLRGVEVTKMETNQNFKEAYVLLITQPINHDKPKGNTFKQRVFLSHVDFKAPTVFITEGYAADYAARPRYTNELCPLLNANQICVEHRNFGKSIADTVTWQTMTVEQAAADHHAIRNLLKKLYPGKWIATGISKGGQTALYYRAFYPKDVDVTVAYVAPLNFAVEDPREEVHITKVGSKECRDKIYNFQIRLLKNKSTFLPMFKEYCDKNKFKLIMDNEVAFDYEVLEYPFGFWQYGTPCDSIPPEDATDSKQMYHLLNVVTPFYYSYQGYHYFVPFFYQAIHELGYYGYDEKPFKQYLKQENYPNTILGPHNVNITYKPETMKFVNDYLQNNGNRIIYLYGEFDPWSASQVMLTGKTDALKIVMKAGSHSTRISILPADQKEQVYQALEKWLGVKIKR